MTEKAPFSVAASAASASARRPAAQARQIRRAQPSTPARAAADGSAPLAAAAGSRSSEASHRQGSLRNARGAGLCGEEHGTRRQQGGRVLKMCARPVLESNEKLQRTYILPAKPALTWLRKQQPAQCVGLYGSSTLEEQASCATSPHLQTLQAGD